MFGDTPLRLVEDAAALERTVERLLASPVVGIDTESDSFHHYQEKVCLIQFSDLEEDYIVDPLAVGDLSPLAPVFARRDIVKVLHGADYDIVCLKRDFSFEIHNVFDTMIASQMLGFDKIGLADLIERFFGWHIDKQYQRHDWAKRPLLDEHLDYARGDTHWLLALREILTVHLKRAGRLRHVREECRLLERREWEPRDFDNDGYLRIKHAGTLDDMGKRVLKRLYIYRDGEARKLDRPTFKVIPDPVLVQIAKTRPTTPDAMDRLFSKKAAMKRRYGDGILEAVKHGLDDDFEVPSQPKPRKKTTSTLRIPGRAVERAMNALKDWRNATCAHDGIAPVAVASNGTLKAIARYRPRTLEELAEVDDVRSWQVSDYGEALLAVLDGAVPADMVGSEGSEDGGGRKRRRRRRRD